MPPAVLLRPVRESDLDTLILWRTDPWFLGEFNDFGFSATTAVRRGWERDGLLGPDDGLLLVTLDDGTPDDGGTAIGEVTWRSLLWGANTASRAWDIGISLLPDYRGMGYGTEAQRVLVSYLFSTTAVNRIEASTDVDNKPEQRCLEKLGFTCEGTLRGAQFRGGAWRDLLLYSRLRTDPAPDAD